jgi:hypothetical protein
LWVNVVEKVQYGRVYGFGSAGRKLLGQDDCNMSLPTAPPPPPPAMVDPAAIVQCDAFKDTLNEQLKKLNERTLLGKNNKLRDDQQQFHDLLNRQEQRMVGLLQFQKSLFLELCTRMELILCDFLTKEMMTMTQLKMMSKQRL